MSDVTINIHGGNVQILPIATQAVQNIYHGKTAGDEGTEERQKQPAVPAEAEFLSSYINKVEDMSRYLAMLSACTTATEFAQVVVTLLENESRITEELVVKKNFFLKLLPLAHKLDKGSGENNIRQRINDALAKRPKKRT